MVVESIHKSESRKLKRQHENGKGRWAFPVISDTILILKNRGARNTRTKIKQISLVNVL